MGHWQLKIMTGSGAFSMGRAVEFLVTGSGYGPSVGTTEVIGSPVTGSGHSPSVGMAEEVGFSVSNSGCGHSMGMTEEDEFLVTGSGHD